MYFGTSLLLASLLVIPAQMDAQGRKKAKSGKTSPAEMIFLSPENPDDTVIIEIFNENAPKAFSAPGAPRFALIGKERKFYLGIGGYVKGTASFDFCNPITNPIYFTTSQIPMNNAPGNGGLFNLSAGTSNVFFNFVGMPNAEYPIGAYINFSFANGNYDLDLQYAYVKWAGFKIGYDFSLFADLNAGPNTIDQEGPSSWPAVSNPQMNYTYTRNNWSFAIGAELPMTASTTNAYTASVNQRIPAIPAYIQYAWDQGNSTVRLAGLFRNMQYRDLIKDKNYNKVGWGVQLTGTLQTCKYLSLYYQGVYGKGISSFIQDLNGLDLDLVPDEKEQGKLKSVEMWGAFAGFQINFTKNVFSNHAYSQVRNYADRYSNGTIPWDEQYRYAQYLVNNVMWNCTSNIQLGLEYLMGRKTIMNGTSRSDHRIQTMVKFSF